MGYAQENIKPYNGEGEKRVQVERMFDNIAPTYDSLNHILSWGIDKNWRRKAVNRLRGYAPRRILDIATGTGDFALLIGKRLQPDELLGVDISEGMMRIAKEKVKNAGLDSMIHFAKEDCTALSFPSDRFEAVTVAFGVRNFEKLDEALREIRRVLTPGGHLVILELSSPRRFPMKQLFHVYSTIVLPLVGRMVSKDYSAYTYLPKTIEAFPQGEVMREILLNAGFAQAEFKRLTMGICTLYDATK